MSVRQSRIPTTRLGRLARLGFAAGEMAAGGLAESARRLAGKTSEQAVSALLTTNNAKKLARRLSGMRGAAMKIGQELSMEGADILPVEFTRALAILRDSADTMPDSQVRRVMGREFGKGWEDRFREFDFQPVSAASIGQVHRVLTRDGRDLALKIQYPGVAHSIDSDVDNMALLMRLMNVLPVEIDIEGIVSEAKRQLRQEADYFTEARYLREYREMVGDNRQLIVPAVHEDLTTRRVLAMDYVEGEPLESLGGDGKAQAERNRIGTELERLVFRELFEFHTMQTDPNFANYLYRPGDGRIVLLDFGSTITFGKPFSERYRQITRALVDNDDDAIWHCAQEIGYLHADDSPSYCARIVDLIKIICEPILEDRDYDFAASDVAPRARDAGFKLIWNSHGELRSPPPETVFLHRKLIGSFLVCGRIKAKINVQRLLREFL